MRGETKRLLLTTIDQHPDWSIKQIAEHLKVTRDYVRSTASRFGYKFRTKSRRDYRRLKVMVVSDNEHIIGSLNRDDMIWIRNKLDSGKEVVINRIYEEP